jgi:hypothetical protein
MVLLTLFAVHVTALELYQDITSFSAKLREVKFTELNTLSEKQISALDNILNKDIPELMEASACLFGNDIVFLIGSTTRSLIISLLCPFSHV